MEFCAFKMSTDKNKDYWIFSSSKHMHGFFQIYYKEILSNYTYTWIDPYVGDIEIRDLEIID
jgi:hypothetical protein